jgi:hypothetical protein
VVICMADSSMPLTETAWAINIDMI